MQGRGLLMEGVGELGVVQLVQRVLLLLERQAGQRERGSQAGQKRFSGKGRKKG